MLQAPSLEKPRSSTPPVSPPIQPSPPRSNRVQNIAIWICAIGLVAAYFLPWASPGDRHFNGLTLFRVDTALSYLAALPILAVTILGLYKNPVARRIVAAALLVFTCLVFVYMGVRVPRVSLITPGSGMVLTAWFALGLFAFSSERRIIRPIDIIAKRLGSRKAALNAYWGTLTPDVHFSSEDFYAEVEEAIRDKQWPGVQLLRIRYTEAGLLSHKREYLRVIRQRQVFDLCAATFGKDYFFSVREAQLPNYLDPRSALALTMGLLLMLFLCFQVAGIIAGTWFFVTFLAFGAWFMFNVLKAGLAQVDAILMQLPVIGVVYEAWFRRDTYFQQDSRLAFLQSVNDLIKKHVAEITSEKGLKYLNCLERQPVLEGLYKRSRMPVGEPEPEREPEPAMV